MYQNFLDLFNGKLHGPHGTGHKTYKIMGVTLNIVGFFVPSVLTTPYPPGNTSHRHRTTRKFPNIPI